MSPALITIIIVIVAVILLMTGKIPIAAIAIAVPVSLVMTGVLTPKEAFANFSNKWPLIFMFMFMVGESLFRTGFADIAGKFAIKMSKDKENLFFLWVMLISAALSAFLSNLGVIACLLPIVLAGVKKGNYSLKKAVLSMAFASSLGGTITLIGTPPNGVVNSVIGTMKLGIKPFRFFDYALVGLPLAIIGIVVIYLISLKVMPKEKVDTESEDYEGPNIKSTFKFRKNKMAIAVITFIVIVIVMAAGSYIPFIKHTLHLDLLTAAALGAIIVIITGTITWKEAYNSVSWTTVISFATLLSLSLALKKSGAVKVIADGMTGLTQSPYLLMVLIVFITMFLTQFTFNTAATGIIAPIAVAAASAVHVSPYPLLMAVAMSASACFMSPIATGPNIAVVGPGRLKFIDFIKAGWVIQLSSFIIIIILVPIFWKF
ncbi:MAG: SLC13/DASS family transporter [Spirochaetales bacterium]|nr:SLC13/DASS family transporter [Spirochaetales bacterium]